MILGTTAGWKFHIIPVMQTDVKAKCGRVPSWGWGFVSNFREIDYVRGDRVCGACLKAL